MSRYISAMQEKKIDGCMSAFDWVVKSIINMFSRDISAALKKKTNGGRIFAFCKFKKGILDMISRDISAATNKTLDDVSTNEFLDIKSN
jgi:hypothetical protein